MGNIDALKHVNKGLWVVLDEEGWPIWCAGWPEACHEHINDALDRGFDDAAKWKVRQAAVVEKTDCKHCGGTGDVRIS